MLIFKTVDTQESVYISESEDPDSSYSHEDSNRKRCSSGPKAKSKKKKRLRIVRNEDVESGNNAHAQSGESNAFLLQRNEQTLLLDQGYQALRIIPWQRAICMTFLGKVEMISAHQQPIRTARNDYPMPAVVRLLCGHHPGQHVVRFSRDGVYRRDRFTCQYCHSQFRRQSLTLDHVVPKHRGGATNWSNIVTACSPCNSRKGGRTPDEAGMKLLQRPYTPRWKPLGTETFGRRDLPEMWRLWLR